MWNKTVDSADLISFKKSVDNKEIIIEARLGNRSWDIFKKYLYGNESYVQEYFAGTREEALQLIDNLKTERDLSEHDIKQLQVMSRKKVLVNLEREYKEYDVEKWIFSVNQGDKVNVVIIRYADEILMDIIMHEQYHPYERQIYGELVRILHLNGQGILNHNVYYFRRRKLNLRKRKGFLLSKIEMGFGVEE